MNLIMLLVFAFKVAGTDLYLIGDWISIDGNEYCVDGGYVSYYDGTAKFKFHWPGQQGRDCDIRLSWPKDRKKLDVNTASMCLERYDDDALSHEVVVFNGQQQCCDKKPYVDRQSFDPGNTGAASGTSSAKPDDTAKPTVAVTDPTSDQLTTPVPQYPNPSSQQLAENFDTTGSGTSGSSSGGSAADFLDQETSANDIIAAQESIQEDQPALPTDRAEDPYRVRRRGARPSHRLF